MSNRTALLGKKLGMSQVWDENGFFVPVTLVDVSTNVVTAVSRLPATSPRLASPRVVTSLRSAPITPKSSSRVRS